MYDPNWRENAAKAIAHSKAQLPAPQFQQISVAVNDNDCYPWLFALDMAGRVWCFDFTDQTWSAMPQKRSGK